MWESCSQSTAGDNWIAPTRVQFDTFEESCYYFGKHSRAVDQWDRAWHTCASLDSSSLLAVIENRAELQWILDVMQQKQIPKVWVDATLARYSGILAKRADPVPAWRGGTALNLNGLFNSSQIYSKMSFFEDTECKNNQEFLLSAFFLDNTGTLRADKENSETKDVGFLCKKHRTAPSAFRKGFNIAQCFWNSEANKTCPQNWT